MASPNKRMKRNVKHENMASSMCEQYETTIDKLPDEMLNMIFNMLNFHGHLRLSGVCTRWKNLVQNDMLFLDNIVFSAGELKEHHTVTRSYRHLDLYTGDHPRDFGENLQQLLKTAETIAFGYTSRSYLNQVLPLCASVNIIQLESAEQDTEWAFNHSTPIIISMTKDLECLERFDDITEISELELWTVPEKELMVKYSKVINSIVIHFNGSLDGWDQFENLQLEHICIAGDLEQTGGSEKGKRALHSFFEQQAPFLKSIEINRQSDFVFDPMRMLLKNLEHIIISAHDTLYLRFNDLRILPKLKCLEYVTKFCRTQEYHLDISELVNLTEIWVSSPGCPVPAPILRFVSTSGDHQPLVAMEKLKISGFHFDITTLKQIVQYMPGLKELDCEGSFQTDDDYSLKAVTQLKKLKHLESLTESNQRFLNNNFLGKLSLPQLRRLVLSAHEIEDCVENEIYGQRRLRKRITKTTLNKLAKNCPKLLRVFGTNMLPDPPEPFIFAQRMNAASKFHTVRPVQKMVNGSKPQFDYDSVESCSSD